jgi:hypothetical protein
MNKPFRRLLEAYALAALVVLALPSRAHAQAATGTAPELGEDRPLEFAWALGLGAGIVQPDVQSETYWSANLRRRLGRRSERANVASSPSSGLRGYLEGEVGYWRGETAFTQDTDLLLGVNLIGAVPTPIVDLYLGVGFGAHFVDEAFLADGQRIDRSQTRFGGNAQFGVEVKAGERVGIFGNGRLDFLSGSTRNRQYNKIWGGVRFYF